MEKFIYQDIPEDILPEDVPHETVNEAFESLNENTFFASCRRSVDRLAKIAAMTAILGGAVHESFAGDEKIGSKLEINNKKSTEQVQSSETQERIDDLQRINSICLEHGVDFIDATSPFSEVYLPKGEVKKVIVHIGQTHAIKAYEDSSRSDRDEVVESQKKIYDILSQAHLKSDEPQVCLQEGLSTEDEVQEALNDKKTHGEFRSHIVDIASDHSVDIELTIKAEIEAVARYSIRYKNSGLKDSTLFDMSRSIQKVLLEEKIDDTTRGRLIEIRELIDRQIDNDVLIYTVGGALMAGKLEHAIIKPAENQEENLRVAREVCKDIGIPFDENQDFYAVIDALPKTQREKAYSLISKYALTKERERPVMDHAEDALKKRKLIFVNFGQEHGLDDVLKEKQEKKRMDGVALIKVHIDRLEKVKNKSNE